MDNVYSHERFVKHMLHFDEYLDYDVAFYVEAAKRQAGPVLELGCGAGRLLIPIAQAGCTITGIEESDLMLTALRNRLAGETEDVSRRVELVQGDILEKMAGLGQFALIFIAFNTIWHLEEKAQQECLRVARQHLAPGGVLIVDVLQPSDLSTFTRTQTCWVHQDSYVQEDGTRVHFDITTQLDPLSQVHTVIYRFDEISGDGTTKSYVVTERLRYLHYSELCLMVAMAGLRVTAAYGSHKMDHLTTGSTFMIICAEVA